MKKYAFIYVVMVALFGSLSAGAVDLPNVVIVSVDAMRPDRMSSYGYPRSTTPNIDQVAERGVMFTDAVTLIPLTNPCMCTFFTSRSPQITGVKRNGANLPPELETMARVMKKAGYTTAAVPGCWALYHSRSGLGKDFDYYVDDNLNFQLEIDARETAERAMELLDNLPEPFLLWLHLPDAHQPHQAVKGFEFDYKKDGVGLGTKISDSYDSELAFADHWVGKLLAELDSRGLLDHALVVIMADHGEGLGEHGIYGHGRGLYEPILRVPMIMAGEGLPAGGRFEAPVNMLDFAPTILSLLGLPHSGQMEGRDLTAAIRSGAELADVTTFFESYGVAILDLPGRKTVARLSKPWLIGMRHGDLKIVFSVKTETWELYDVKNDPDENHNLYDPRNADYQAMADKLMEWFEKNYGGK